MGFGPARVCAGAVRGRVLTPLPPLPETPLVSVIVPSYNQGAYIRQTLESVFSQEWPRVELIVIDGGSTDDTIDVLKRIAPCDGFCWISEPDDGVVDAVNKGFRMAQGDIVAVQSSDDFYLENAFSSIVDAFRLHPRAALIYGDAVKIDAIGTELTRRVGPPYSLERFLLCECAIPQPAAFFRREVLAEIGDWDPDLPYTPDTDLWLRIGLRYDVVKLDQFLATRRMHEEQRDRQCAAIVRDYGKMLEKSEGLRTVEPRIRRAAAAGRHLIQIRYNVRGTNMAKVFHILSAARYRPDRIRWAGLWRHLVYFPLHRLGSSAKKAMQRLQSSEKEES